MSPLRDVPKPGQYCVMDDQDGSYADGWFWMHPYFDTRQEAIDHCCSSSGRWIGKVVSLPGIGWTLEEIEGPFGEN